MLAVKSNYGFIIVANLFVLENANQNKNLRTNQFCSWLKICITRQMVQAALALGTECGLTPACLGVEIERPAGNILSLSSLIAPRSVTLSGSLTQLRILVSECVAWSRSLMSYTHVTCTKSSDPWIVCVTWNYSCDHSSFPVVSTLYSKTRK